MISKMNFCGQDEKIKKYLMPEKLLFKAGDVSGEENIFIKKDIQISTTEADCLVMSNSGGGEHAAVLLDFGFEFSGGVKILTEVFGCDSGIPEFRLVFGESAREAMSDIGEKNSTNDHSMRDFTVRLPMFSDMEFAQTGYRFIRIELLSDNATVKIKSVLGVFTYRDIPYLGSFRCSDGELNDIYSVAAYTCHLNMQGMIWDGIKRDRLVWIGDMHPEMLTVRTVFGNNPCILRGLDFASRNNPLPMYPNNMVTYAMWWLLIARDWYFYTGETDFALSHREYIKGLLEQLCALVESDGGDKLGQLNMGYFLDWPTYGREEAKAGVRALFAMSLDAGAELCGVMGEKELADKCLKKCKLLGSKVSDVSELKAPAALMVLAGHTDPVSAAEKVLLPGGAKGFSTFMSYYMLSALADAGKTAEALSMLKTYYGGMLKAGATTFWEDFDIDWLKDGAALDSLSGEYDIHGDNGAHCYIGYRHSLCHGWSSAPAAFLAERVLGIRLLEPGCRRIGIYPELGGLEWAEGEYPTPYGTVSVKCRKTGDGKISVEYKAPEQIEIETGSGVSM